MGMHGHHTKKKRKGPLTYHPMLQCSQPLLIPGVSLLSIPIMTPILSGPVGPQEGGWFSRRHRASQPSNSAMGLPEAEEVDAVKSG